MTRRQTAAFLAPGLGWLALLLVVPCALIFANAFFERGVYGGIDYVFTLENFGRAVDPLYLRIFLDSARIAALTTLVAVVVGYPAAYAIARARPGMQAALLILVMLPFWSNSLIRTYAWIVLLNSEGIVSSGLQGLGVIDEPVNLLYDQWSIIVGLVYNYLPFVVLAIYASVQRLDQSLLEASEDLGAPAWKTFLRVILPLTLPGVAAGAVFVFVLSIGNFITPELLGGKQVQMIGNLIYSQFLTARDWPFGSALALLLIAVMLCLLFAQALLVRRAQGERSTHA